MELVFFTLLLLAIVLVQICFADAALARTRSSVSSVSAGLNSDDLNMVSMRSYANGTSFRDEYEKMCAERGVVSRLRNDGQQITSYLNGQSRTPAPTNLPREDRAATNGFQSTAQQTRYQPATTNPGGSLADKIAAYSMSSQVRSMVIYADTRNLGSRHGLCATWVKMAMTQANVSGREILIRSRDGRWTTNGRQRSAGAIPGTSPLEHGYPPGKDGIEMSRYLNRTGYINLLASSEYRNIMQNNPAAAPYGAILIWAGGSSGDGHTEIRTDRGLVSDFPRAATTMGNSYRLVGVYIKDMGSQVPSQNRLASR